MFKIIFFFFISVSLFATSLNIAVAANVSYALPSLIKEFNKQYPNIKVDTTIGSSGKLTAQILYKAPYDIFLSANMKYPQKLYIEHLTLTKPIVYANGSVVLLSNKLNLNDTIENILKNPTIKKIAIANDKTAPYGVAAKQILQNLKLYNKLKSKFIYGESISTTFRYTLNMADIGFIAKSALFSPKLLKYKHQLVWKEIDKSLYTPIQQGVVILQHGKNKKGVKEFYDFLLSKKAKQILNTFGYDTK